MNPKRAVRSVVPLFLALVLLCAGPVAAQCKLGVPAIKVGVQGAASGPHSDYGRQIEMGATMAIEEINAAGGIARLQGRDAVHGRREQGRHRRQERAAAGDRLGRALHGRDRLERRRDGDGAGARGAEAHPLLHARGDPPPDRGAGGGKGHQGNRAGERSRSTRTRSSPRSSSRTARTSSAGPPSARTTSTATWRGTCSRRR